MAFTTFGRNFNDDKPDSFLEEDFAPHFEAWKKTPTPETSGNLLKAIDPVIQSAMRTYAGQGQLSPTLRSKAKMIALDSMARYDPSRAKLRTHLMTNLQGLRRSAAEESQIIDVPERIRLDSGRLHGAELELEDRLGRAPSDAEVAAHMGVSVRRLAHIRKARPPISEGSLETFANDMGEVEQAMPAVMQRSSTENDPWLQFVYMDLPPADQFIMESILGLNGKKVMAKGDIARKLGLSAGAVSQRAAKIQKMLDRRYELQTNLFQ